MKITAIVENFQNNHSAIVTTNNNSQPLAISPKVSGNGSSINGGEFLMMALATCFCNDLYREATKKNITLTKVLVEASGEFGGPGDPGFNIKYFARIEGDVPDDELHNLIKHTDTVAEIQNTLRKGVNVLLAS